MVPLEVVDEFRAPPGEIARLVLLGVRQIQRGAGLDGHVAVRHRTLQSEYGREPVHMRRIRGRLFLAQEPEVVVPVHALRRTPGLTTLICEVTW